LLAAFVPALLMLATFGLERLESSLTRDSVATADRPDFLQQSQTGEVKTPSRNGAGQALDGRHRLRYERSAVSVDGPSLPTRVYAHHRSNPQFQAPQHADRV
jgi:hypothetical protein